MSHKRVTEKEKKERQKGRTIGRKWGQGERGILSENREKDTEREK